MQTTITARHCEIPERSGSAPKPSSSAWASIAPRPIEATVVFDAEGPQQHGRASAARAAR